jgi:hypothetical protein
MKPRAISECTLPAASSAVEPPAIGHARLPHRDSSHAGLDLALGQVAVADHHAAAAGIALAGEGREEVIDRGLERSRQQLLATPLQDFRDRIATADWLGRGAIRNVTHVAYPSAPVWEQRCQG